MTKSWRPEGWDDVEGHITGELYELYGHLPILAIAKAVEAGADALLEALEKEGIQISFIEVGKIMRKARKDYNERHKDDR